MYKSKLIEDIIVNHNGLNFFVDLDVTAKLVDGSFSHGFGLESCKEIEFDSSDLETVCDHEGNVVTNRKLINEIENRIDPTDYLEQFCIDDFQN
jgi:hypothetical protein